MEAIDEAVPETDSVELDANDELPVEDGFVSGKSYQAEMPSFEAEGGVPIDEAHFPDPNVRNTLRTGAMHLNYGVTKSYDQNQNGWLDSEEIGEIIEFSINSTSDLSGLEVLTALTRLDVGKFTGTTIDLSAFTKLPMFLMNGSDTLTTLILPESLTDCGIYSSPQLTTVDISRCTRLEYLGMYNTDKIESMDFSGHPSLKGLIFLGKSF